MGEEPPDGSYDPEASENLFFAAQTIQNACGTQALLSVLLNQDDKIAIGDQLKEFKEFTAAFPSEVRPPNTSAYIYEITDIDSSYEETSSPILNSSEPYTTPSPVPHHSLMKPPAQPPKMTKHSTS